MEGIRNQAFVFFKLVADKSSSQNPGFAPRTGNFVVDVGAWSDTKALDEIVATIKFIVENDSVHGTTLEISGGIIGKGLAK